MANESFRSLEQSLQPVTIERHRQLLSLLPKPWCHRPYQIFLLGGQSNANYLLREGSGQDLVLRINRAKPELGLDHHLEMAMQRFAAKQGLSPAIVWSDASRGWVLSEYCQDQSHSVCVDGRSAGTAHCNDDYSHSLIKALAQSVAQLHGQHADSLPVELQGRDIIAHIQTYQRRLGAVIEPFCSAHGLNQVSDSFRLATKQWQALAQEPLFKPVPCHCDLHRQNVLYHQGRCLFIDWEYAAWSPAILDIASLQMSYEWQPDELAKFLAHYERHLGQTMAQQIVLHLPLAGFLLALQSLYWALLHHGVKQVPAIYIDSLKQQTERLTLPSSIG